jgi:hypothetical protein
LIDVYSRIVLRSPISTVGSPDFLSWFAPRSNKWKMRLSHPMRVWSVLGYARHRVFADLDVAVDHRVRPDIPRRAWRAVTTAAGWMDVIGRINHR